MAQIGLFPLPEVKWDPQKKQWQSPTSQKHDAPQERYALQGKEPGQVQIKRRRRRRKKEEILQERLAEKGRKLLKTADGRRDQHEVLENSGQLLLESGDKCHSANGYQTQGGQINQTATLLQHGASNLKVRKPTERPLNVTPGAENLLDVTVFPMQGRIRMSQLRHQARLKNHQSAEQLQEANNLRLVVADQIQEVMGRQDVEEILAKCYSQMVEGRDKDQIHEELNQRDAAGTGLAQENVCKERRIAQSNANNAVYTANELLLKNDEMTDHRCIARHHRMLRTYQRRKRLREKHLRASRQGYLTADAQRVWMYETEKQWQWHMWNVQGWHLWEAEQQRLMHMSHHEREQYRIAQISGEQIEEQRASHNVHKLLNSHQLSKQNLDIIGGAHRLHIVQRTDQDRWEVEVNRESCKDQAKEEQIYGTTKVSEQAGEKNSFVEGRIRLSELKREARLRNTNVLERSHS